MLFNIVLLFILCSICRSQNTSIENDNSPIFKPLIDPGELYSSIMDNLGDTEEARLIAIKLVDASTKYPSGYLEGNMVDMGNFDECYNFHQSGVYGKYCMGIQFSSVFYENLADDMKVNISRLLVRQKELTERLNKQVNIENFAYRVGACVPHNMSLIGIPSEFIFLEALCSSQPTTERPWSGAAITTSLVFALIFGIAIASTIYEIITRYQNQKNYHWSLTAFSYLTNTSKLFSISSEDDSLGCLRGIKSISMFWVMWAHFAGDVAATAMNMYRVVEMEKDPLFVPLFNGQVSVDTFLLMGGLLTTYSFLITQHKGARVNILIFYLHRYIRLTPIYLFVMLFCRNLIWYMGSGPIWLALDKMLISPCKDGWWSNLLYMGNYLHKDVCLGQSYYLHIDMQLFFLSPIFLYPFAKYPKTILSALGGLWVVSIFVAYYTAISTGAGAFTITLRALQDFTFPTHTRFGTYIAGMVLGYLIFKQKISSDKFKLTKVQTILAWVFALTTSSIVQYSGYGVLNNVNPNTKVLDALYVSFERPIWCIAIATIIFLCVTGHGGFINEFLSCKLFVITAKLSYSLFLVHLVILSMFVASSKTNAHIDNLSMLHGFFGDVVFYFMVAIVFSLTFESPVIVIEKHLLTTKKASTNVAPPIQEVVQVQETAPASPSENNI